MSSCGCKNKYNNYKSNQGGCYGSYFDLYGSKYGQGCTSGRGYGQGSSSQGFGQGSSSQGYRPSQPTQSTNQRYENFRDINGETERVVNHSYYDNYYTRYNNIYVTNCNHVTDYCRDVNIYHYDSNTVYEGSVYLGSFEEGRDIRQDFNANGFDGNGFGGNGCRPNPCRPEPCKPNPCRCGCKPCMCKQSRY